jgi:ribonuclease D
VARPLSLNVEGRTVEVRVHKGDLPADFSSAGPIAIDCEAMGLSLVRDRLCLVQLTDGAGVVHLVQLERETFDCPRLKGLLSSPQVLKIFHYARYDIAMIQRWLGVPCFPVWCTKIASRLTRTYTDRHSLKELTRELLGVDLSKAQQSSDWGAETLSDAQLAYAASDVVHLHELKARLEEVLEREGRTALAQACFDFLPVRAALDLSGWAEEDIFSHS